MSSINLDQDAIICFIENLCKVSKQELSDAMNPRKFSLQAIVEVADLNMARIRFVWTKICSEFTASVAGTEPHVIASFACSSTGVGWCKETSCVQSWRAANLF